MLHFTDISNDIALMFVSWKIHSINSAQLPKPCHSYCTLHTTFYWLYFTDFTALWLEHTAHCTSLIQIALPQLFSCDCIVGECIEWHCIVSQWIEWQPTGKQITSSWVDIELSCLRPLPSVVHISIHSTRMGYSIFMLSIVYQFSHSFLQDSLQHTNAKHKLNDECVDHALKL